MAASRLGFLAAVGAYVLWGLFPLYWPLLEPVARLGRRRTGLLVLAAILVTVNWGMFIYAVNSDQVVETSLGYFINPLVTVLLAVTVLRERLRRRQVAAVGIAALGVVV